MNRFARALLTLSLLLSGNLYAAISGTARSSPQYDNCGTGDWGGASCQVNISGTTGFAANDLIVAVWSRNDDTTDLAPVLPSEGGWTQGPWYGASTAGKIACSVAWKKASGSETTVTPSWSYTGTAQGGKVMAMVIPGTDLNLNALGDSSENEANVASATTSLSSGSASNSTATGLAIAAFCSDNDTDQTGPPTYTNSFTAQATSLTGAYAKTWAATKVLSSAAAQTTTATIVSDEGYGSILVFNASGSTCPATCAGGRSARCITDISDASDPDNLLYGLSPAAVANEDTVCYDPASTLTHTVNVDASGWPSIASGGSQLTDSFDYCIMDNAAACGTDGKYEVTFQPVITSVTGIGTGQTTGTVTVTPAGPTEGTVRGVAISKTSYDTYGAPSHAQIAAGVDANNANVAWGSEFTKSFLSTVSPGWTFGRASSQTYEKSDGTLGTVTSGNPAFTYSGGTAQGVLLEGAQTNTILYSQNLTTGTTVRGTPTLTANNTTAPDGTTTATLFSGLGASGANDAYNVDPIGGTAEAPVAVSFYLKKGAATGQLNIQNTATPTYGRWTIDLSSVGSGWERVTATHPAVTVVSPFKKHTTTNDGWGLAYVSGSGDIHVWGMQFEVDQSFPTSYVKTEGSSVNRVATDLTRSWNFPSNGISGQAVVRPQFAYNDNKNGYNSVITLRYDASNYVRILLEPANDIINLTRQVGGAFGYNYTSAGELNYARNERLNIRFRIDTTGLYLWVDDSNSSTVDSCTTANCKASFVTPPNTIRLGDDASITSSATHLPLIVESLTIWNEAKSDAFLEALE